MALASAQPDKTVLGKPKQQQQQISQPDSLPSSQPLPPSPPRAPARVAIAAAPKSPSFEFRGFDFFTKREFNDLKSASRAYFAPTSEKQNGNPSSWLGDATPPVSPRPSVAGPPIANDGLVIASHNKSPSSGKRIFGVRRSRFWILVALIGLLLLVAIGVGVGVGVGSRAKHESGSAVPAAASRSSSITTVSTSDAPITSLSSMNTPLSSKTSTSSTSSPTGNAEGKLDCPAVNGTTYQVPGSNKQFLRLCGVDYSGNGQATDLRQVLTEDMLDCIKNCAGTTNCTGCGWGYLEGDVGTQHKCWLKTGLMKSQDANVNWAFAVLL
ncbi:hypothetical protein F5B20DRAFT_550000 [Whalleya microplaca]|nr:hypothetical protein F5B20DRAFT_550000 [Whalleya microplaca]